MLIAYEESIGGGQAKRVSNQKGFAGKLNEAHVKSPKYNSLCVVSGRWYGCGFNFWLVLLGLPLNE